MYANRLAIHWFRRDLRITDNRALRVAIDRAPEVLPVYILNGWEKSHPWTGSKRQQFLCDSLASLAGNLARGGGRLLIGHGKALDPQADYIRRWLPELRDVSTPLLMEPPKDSRPIADGYPAPIIDHAAERKRTLAMFKKHRP